MCNVYANIYVIHAWKTCIHSVAQIEIHKKIREKYSARIYAKNRASIYALYTQNVYMW